VAAHAAPPAGMSGEGPPPGARLPGRVRAGPVALAIPAGLVVAAGAYWLLVRPWHLRWGATAGEVQSAWTGDHLLPHPLGASTHAITIRSPAAQVWPWIVQIGQGRGGFYSYAWVENLLGCQIENASRILPEHQQLRVGDPVWLHPNAPPLTVAIVEPGHTLVLAATEEQDGFQVVSGTWAFFLRELGEHAARLIVRSRWSWPPTLFRWVGYRLGLEPMHFVMERRMLLGIKERAEGRSPGEASQG
jgi:hypothetical protein